MPEVIGRKLFPWTCRKPGCMSSGLGYAGKRWCSTRHRVWGVRQRKREQGYMRTRRGYVRIDEQPVSA